MADRDEEQPGRQVRRQDDVREGDQLHLVEHHRPEVGELGATGLGVVGEDGGQRRRIELQVRLIPRRFELRERRHRIVAGRSRALLCRRGGQHEHGTQDGRNHRRISFARRRVIVAQT